MTKKEVWDGLPESKENAVSYSELVDILRIRKRGVREKLSEIAKESHKDGVLIRSTKGGFYKSSDKDDIMLYRHQVVGRIKSLVKELKTIDEFLVGSYDYYSLIDDLVREDSEDDRN